MGRQHHPVVGLAGHVEEQVADLGRCLGRLQDQTHHRSAGRRRCQQRGCIPADSDCRNAGLGRATRRPRHGAVRQRSGNQEASGTGLDRGTVLQPAVDGAGRKHQFVPHQDDPAGNLGPVGREILRRSPSEIEHLCFQTARPGRRGPDQRVTIEHLSSRPGQFGPVAAPADIGYGHRAGGHTGCLAAQVLQQGTGGLFAGRPRQPAAAIADPLEVAPQARLGNVRHDRGSLVKVKLGPDFSFSSSMSRSVRAGLVGCRSALKNTPTS